MSVAEHSRYTGGIPAVPFPKAMARFPRLRQSLLGAFDLCALEARLGQEYEYLDELGDPTDPFMASLERLQWHSHPQARGTVTHRWAHKLLDLLQSLGQNQLADEPECPSCGDTPNQTYAVYPTPEEPNPVQPGYTEGQTCPSCQRDVLVMRPLMDVALDLLVDTLRQDDMPVEDIVRVPQKEVKDLEWIVVKFAREQRFKIANYYGGEERFEAALEYPAPDGGSVKRILTGQLDALFLEQDEGGGKDDLHAVVIDWKDTWAIPGVSTISRDGYWQQRFYAWLVMMQNPNIQRVTLREVYVRYKAGESGRDNHREATITRAKLPLIERQLAVVAESFDRAWESFEDLRAFEAEYSQTPISDDPALAKRHRVLQRRVKALFSPSPGGHCNYCPLPHKCPIVDDVRVHGTARTMEDAKRIAGELAVITRAKKHRENAIKGWLEKMRTVPVEKATEDDEVRLRTYTDKPPGLPEGVPLRHAKGNKSYALVEGTRKAKPDREAAAEMLELARAGQEVDLDDYYREATSTTLRLVEEKVPTDEAAVLSPQIEEALAHALDRLERMRQL